MLRRVDCLAADARLEGQRIRFGRHAFGIDFHLALRVRAEMMAADLEPEDHLFAAGPDLLGDAFQPDAAGNVAVGEELPGQQRADGFAAEDDQHRGEDGQADADLAGAVEPAVVRQRCEVRLARLLLGLVRRRGDHGRRHAPGVRTGLVELQRRDQPMAEALDLVLDVEGEVFIAEPALERPDEDDDAGRDPQDKLARKHEGPQLPRRILEAVDEPVGEAGGSQHGGKDRHGERDGPDQPEPALPPTELVDLSEDRRWNHDSSVVSGPLNLPRRG